MPSLLGKGDLLYIPLGLASIVKGYLLFLPTEKVVLGTGDTAHTPLEGHRGSREAKFHMDGCKAEL